MTSPQTVTRSLGLAGLVPFVLPAVLIVSGSALASPASQLVNAYALAIICFLSGSWWGMAQSSGVRSTLILSNLYLLFALALYLFAREWWPLAAMLLLLGAWVCERSPGLFPVRAHSYQRMRGLLTLGAASSMGAIQFAA